MEFLGIILVLGPFVAFLLRTFGQRWEHFYVARIVALSVSLAAALLLVFDYLFCTMAFASFSPIFHIEYSYEPHDLLIGGAFADVLICTIGIVRNAIHLVQWRKGNVRRKEQFKKQMEEIGELQVPSNRP